MPAVGGNTGFKTTRDLLLFVVGTVGLMYHLFTADGMVQLEVMMFMGGLMGAPYVLGMDEKAATNKETA